MIRFLPVILVMVLLVGCTPPAELPPNLDDTPGAPFTYADGEYSNAIFRVRVPEGWRVITGEASAPPRVTLSPSPCTFIEIRIIPPEEVPSASALIDESDCPARLHEVAQVALGDDRVRIFGIVPETEWEAFLPIFDQVRVSLQATIPETTPEGEG